MAEPVVAPIIGANLSATLQDGPRLSLAEVVRRLRAGGRQGDMLDAHEAVRNGRAVYVVIWEYPNGRIGNIYVDQRTGAVLGED